MTRFCSELAKKTSDDVLQRAEPLSSMTALGPAMAYWAPEDARLDPARGERGPPEDPDLIVLCSWLGADDKHIAKYIKQHRKIFPSSPILLIRCRILRAFLVWTPYFARMEIDPILPFLRALSTETRADNDAKHGSTGPPRFLLHVFSQGGVDTLMYLQSLLVESRQKNSVMEIERLPSYVLLLDSCPIQLGKENAVVIAGQLRLPWFLEWLLLRLSTIWLLYYAIQRKAPYTHRFNMALQDVNWLSYECRRTYLYSAQDEVLQRADIERHACEAEKTGMSVRRECFEGAGHVKLAKADHRRYWKVVYESWFDCSKAGDGPPVFRL